MGHERTPCSVHGPKAKHRFTQRFTLSLWPRTDCRRSDTVACACVCTGASVDKRTQTASSWVGQGVAGFKQLRDSRGRGACPTPAARHIRHVSPHTDLGVVGVGGGEVGEHTSAVQGLPVEGGVGEGLQERRGQRLGFVEGVRVHGGGVELRGMQKPHHAPVSHVPHVSLGRASNAQSPHALLKRPLTHVDVVPGQLLGQEVAHARTRVQLGQLSSVPMQRSRREVKRLRQGTEHNTDMQYAC